MVHAPRQINWHKHGQRVHDDIWHRGFYDFSTRIPRFHNFLRYRFEQRITIEDAAIAFASMGIVEYLEACNVHVIGQEKFFGLVYFGAPRVEAPEHPVFPHTNIQHDHVEEAVTE